MSSPDFGLVKKINHHPKRENDSSHDSPYDSLTTHLWLTHDSLTTHSWLMPDSSLSQLCFMTSFTTHFWVNYALWLPLQLTSESIMLYDFPLWLISESIMPYSFLYDSPMSQLWFNNFLGFIYDSQVVSTTYTWVRFLDRRSQSGSAAKTSVEYKRDPNSAPKRIR